MNSQGFLIPVFTNGEQNPFLLTLFNVVYWGVVLAVVIDIVRTIYRMRKKRIHTLSFEDYDNVLNGTIRLAMTPMWMDTPISDFNHAAGAFHRTMNKILVKNGEYLAALHSLDPNSEEYKNAVEAEYYVVNAMGEAASDLCNRFGDDYHEIYHSYSQCPLSVVQKYCTLVKMLQVQTHQIETEEFIPPELKDKYLLIMKSIMALVDIINSNIQIL